jgi:putative ABC transport system permease protein
MNIKDFQMGWRVMLKAPGYSLIMVLSLTVGFAVWFLALGFTRYEYSYDDTVPQLEDVYVLKARPNWGHSSWTENVPLAMKESLDRSGLALQSTAVIPLPVSIRVGDVVSNMQLTVVDPAFSKVFAATALDGDLDAALGRPDAVALSQDTALGLFGETHVLGRQILINGEPHRVVAIMANQPKPSSIQFQVLAGLVSTAWSAQQRERAKDSGNYYAQDGRDIVSCKVYLRMKGADQRKAAIAAIRSDVESSPLRARLTPANIAEVGDKGLFRVEIGPLADSYLDSDARDNSGPKGDPVANYAMNGVALLVLLLTAGNYINLANIRVVQRQREMAVRKVLGVKPVQLAAQLTAESILVSVTAALLGAVLAYALLPTWSDLTDHDIASILTPLDHAIFIGIVLVSGLVMGVGAGIYPTVTALKLHVTPVLSGRDGSDTAGGLLLRRILTVMQFGIAMFVAAMIVTVAWQIEFLKGIDYGYRVDGLTIIKIPPEMGKSESNAFKLALKKLPEVSAVAGSSTRSTNQDFMSVKGETITLGTRLVGAEYFSTLELGASVGRMFNEKQDAGENADVVVMNGLAALRLGYPAASAAVGQFVRMNGRTVQVVGISNEVSNGFIVGPPRPLVYVLSDATPEITIRSSGSNASAAQASVEALWRQYFPTRYLSVRNLRAQLEMNAGGPQAVLQTCVVMAAVIIPLAVFSIYVLSALVVQRRAREFVVRKLHGANAKDIARLLLREFGMLQGIAAGIALPLAYFAGRGFMERFADQAAIGIWASVAALLGALLVTGMATFRHILTASRLAPALVLRTA